MSPPGKEDREAYVRGARKKEEATRTRRR